MLNIHLLQRQKVSGYSLIELIITIVVTSIVMVIFYSVFAPNQKNSVSPVIQVKASELGQAYLEEIMLKRFDENSPIGNGIPCNRDVLLQPCGAISTEELNRALFDDVDDYHLLNDIPAKDALGNNRVGFSNFEVDVFVNYAGGDFGFAAQDLKKVTVTVTTPLGGTFVFSQYKGNF